MLNQDTCQPQSSAETIESVLRTLVHDVRSPLGVADGYIRLLLGGKLTAAEDQQRALSAALDALTRISALCDLATQCVQPPPPAPLPRIPALLLCERVWNATGQSRPADEPEALTATVCVGTSLDRAVDAIVCVLGTSIHVTCSLTELSLASDAGGGASAGSLERAAAERLLTNVGARLDCSAADRQVAVIFPLDGDHT